jgi:chromate transporter
MSGEITPPWKIFQVFLALGCTSFGGPVAHLGYFRRTFVEQRAWISATDYASLLALCQFLPGPASSQVGFGIGLHRGGWRGGVAAWCGFTLPSALAMFAIATFIGAFDSSPLARGLLHGLQLAAVAVVAQAVWMMGRSLCPDTPRRALALLAAGILVMFPATFGQLFVLALGAAVGRFILEEPAGEHVAMPGGHIPSLICLGACGTLLLAAFLVPVHGLLGIFGAFYRSGALVFGGGHVLLPLLRDAVVVPGLVSPTNFLAGYGAAQAMPGPLFTVAAFLGAVAAGPAGAAIATVAIFLPGLLLVAGALPYWRALQTRRGIAAALRGVNAVTIGLLGMAFITLFTLTAMQRWWDMPISLLALLLLTLGKARPILVVAFCAAAGMIV